jgi:selenide,water dikinase
VEAGLRGGTDITGFGLLGHGSEMAEASGVRLRFRFERIPFTRGARGYAARFIFPGGSMDNKLFFGERVTFTGDFDDGEQMLLFDAQTSGGLLLAVPPEKLPRLLERAAQVGQPLWVVGDVIPGAGIEVEK